MTVVRVTRTNLSGEHTAEDHSYSHSYEVEVSSRNDQQGTVLTAAGIPRLGERHPSDMSAVCTSVRARLRDERRWKLWSVDANYAILAGQDDVVTRDPTQAPDLRAPELRIRSAQRELARTEDRDGNPIANTVGDMYPQHMRTVTSYYAVINYRRWFRAIDLDPYSAVLQWCGKFNENAWFTAPARTIQIQGLSFEREFWNGQLFFRTDFDLAGPEDDSIFLPNEGMHVLAIDVQNGGFVKIPALLEDINDAGLPTGRTFRVSEPVPISQDGFSELTAGQRPITNVFRMYDPIDFADIGL